MSLVRKLNKQVLRQLNKDTHNALYRYLKNHHNDEADWQDFKQKLETWKEELNK